MVGYAERCGSLDNVATVLAELSESQLYHLKEQSYQRGIPLEIVVGSAPAWADPWSRAQLAQVEKERGRCVIHEEEIQLARLAGSAGVAPVG